MRKIISLSLCLVFSLFIFNNVNALSKDKINIDSKSIKKQTNLLNVDLTYPQIEGIKNIIIQTKINNELKDKILIFKCEVEKEAEKYETEAVKNGWNKIKFESVSTYNLCAINNNMLSLYIDLYAYTGGVHGITKRITYNIDLHSGKNICLKDLFIDGYDYKSVINKSIYKNILSSKKGKFFDNEFTTISDIQPFCITKDELIIYFNPYEIAPYSEGIPSFKIPLSLFKSNLNENIVKLYR